MRIEYFQEGMSLSDKVDFSISKAKLQEDLEKLLAKGANIEIRPFNYKLGDLISEKISKVEYWCSAYQEQKIVLVSAAGGRLVIGS
ncbi:MAG: hypothetical protein ACQERJ_07740 [Bacillota bacterium]